MRSGGGNAGRMAGGSRELRTRQLEAIFRRTCGDRSPAPSRPLEVRRQDAPKLLNAEIGGTFLLVDGYNIIFAWDELNKLAKVDPVVAARNQLIHILSNYQGVPLQGHSGVRRL